jgi:peptide/nickel transport system substrate-binding protein
MRRIRLILIAGWLLASCLPQPAPVPTSIPSPIVTTAALHAAEIRFALMGQLRDINVWQLFDASGASYADYALRSEYWPRLYQLAPPEFNFQPLAADEMPSTVAQEGEGYSANVKLRSDLKWTDGSPFTAQDVAFTINTAVKYELEYDWASYYSRDFLDRVEAVDAITVKFYFKQKPNVGIWQYGALQGPIVQKAFWESKISDARTFLPDDQLNSDIETARAYQASVEARVNELAAQLNQLYINGKENRKLAGELVKRQDELGHANNSLNDLLEERAAHIESAHQSLYAIDDANEPTLGTWMPAGEQNGVWTNEANPDFPYTQPHFDRAIYQTYSDEQSAYSAFTSGDVDVILSSTDQLEIQPAFSVSPTRTERFLVFNPANLVLQDLNLREVLACISNVESTEFLQGTFVLSNAWKNNDVSLPCGGLSNEQRIEKAIEILKAAGYQWSQQPNALQQGAGMTLPDGGEFPRIVLMLSRGMEAANHIQQQALHLGIPIDVQSTDPASLQYSVYSSKKYDMALVSWKLSEYPGYLCEWFGVGGQFEYASDRLQSACEALAVESDLEAAREKVFAIQSILSEDLPFVPLYTETTYDVFQNVEYPFAQVPGGLSGLYGAPSYAIPAK